MAGIIETVNKDVLKSFKSLQKKKNILYTESNGTSLTAITEKTMIVYTNPKEINFKGTYKLTRSKLIPVEYSLSSDLDVIGSDKLERIKSFDKNKIDAFQIFCYEENLYVNIAEIIDTIEKLFEVYSEFTLYKNTEKKEVVLEFSKSGHKTYLISKLLQ